MDPACWTLGHAGNLTTLKPGVPAQQNFPSTNGIHNKPRNLCRNSMHTKLSCQVNTLTPQKHHNWVCISHLVKKECSNTVKGFVRVGRCEVRKRWHLAGWQKDSRCCSADSSCKTFSSEPLTSFNMQQLDLIIFPGRGWSAGRP